jgi:hypothetical protein
MYRYAIAGWFTNLSSFSTGKGQGLEIMISFRACWYKNAKMQKGSKFHNFHHKKS